MSDITTALRLIDARQDDYTTADAYYQGTVDEKLLVTSAALKKIFTQHGKDYMLNFASIVVDAVLNRIEIENVIGGSKASTDAISKIWEQNELDLEVDEIHRRALVYGECYATVWPDENGEVLISYAAPTNTCIVYDPNNPRKKLFGAKYWEIPGKTPAAQPSSMRMTVYYPDRVTSYEAPYAQNPENGAWRAIKTIDNPWGEVPMFHFRTGRPYGKPEHLDAYQPQNIINKLTITHMYTVDYQGAAQRYALSSGNNSSEFDDFDEQGTDAENIAALKSSPGELWYLKGVTQVGSFPAADPNVFITPVTTAIRMMASMTNTPLHYFEKTGNVPSGEALRAAEAPLIKKVKSRELSFGSTWRDLFKFSLKILGVTNSDIQVKWTDPESTDTSTEWAIALQKKSVGMPLDQILRESGYDDDVIKSIMDTIKAQQDAATAAGATGFDTGTSSAGGLGNNLHNELLHEQAVKNKQANNGAPALPAPQDPKQQGHQNT